MNFAFQVSTERFKHIKMDINRDLGKLYRKKNRSKREKNMNHF